MEHLEAFSKSAQNRDRILGTGLVDENGLESTLQCRIGFDVLAILVESGGTDHVQFAACEHRFEHVAGIERPLAADRARSDHGMQLVDEQQDAPLGSLHLGQHGLQSLLELAAVLRTGHQRTHVEREDRLVA